VTVGDAPSVQSFEEKLDKLWKNYPMKTDFTAPLTMDGLCTLQTHADTVTQSRSTQCQRYSFGTTAWAGMYNISQKITYRDNTKH